MPLPSGAIGIKKKEQKNRDLLYGSARWLQTICFEQQADDLGISTQNKIGKHSSFQ